MMNDTDMEELNPFKTILLATDGSEFSAGVEQVGMEMASQHQSQLYVLRLLLSEEGSDEASAEEQEAKIDLERVIHQSAERGISCTPLIQFCQEPSQGILSTIKDVGAQLVILGCRGRRGLAKLMVGDATTKVIDKAECSVLVVSRLVTSWNSGVLLALDSMEPDGDRAALAAFHLAQSAQVPLTILLVVDDDEVEDRENYQLLNRLVAMAKLKNLEVDSMVQSGEIDDVILEVARQRSADIIVCEPRDRSVIEKLFNTNKLIHLIGRARCPVMVVQGPES
ncbi:MAG: universal stress protein [Magnetococcus sp. DMHC-6]